MVLLLPLGALTGLFGLLYLPVLWDLVQVWEADQNYSHGFLIPLLAGYLIWSRKETLRNLMVQPSTWGGLILCLGLLFLLGGWAIDTVGSGRAGLFVKGLSLILVLSGLVLLLLGKDILKQLAFPLAYLIFMIPLPVGLFAMATFPLQLHATSVTTVALQAFSIPVLSEGNLIHLPSITLGITEACSGIRSLFTLLAGAVALSYFTQPLWWQRVILVVSVVPITIVANAFRIIGTGLLAYYVGGEMAGGFFHGFSGWLVIVMASLLLFAEAHLLARFPGKAQEEVASS